VGPSWSCQPPSLTISVKHAQFDTRASVGSKQLLSYAVETLEYGSCVTRKYKQFLWLYDKLAESFPCISLPPLPVKQSSCESGICWARANYTLWARAFLVNIWNSRLDRVESRK